MAQTPPHRNCLPQKRRRRYGTGPPARFLITWILLSDPGLRSALEYTATVAGSHRARGHLLRVRTVMYTACVALLAGLVTRLVLALM